MPTGFDPALGVISRGNGLLGVTPTQASQVSPTLYSLTVDNPAGSNDEDLLVGVLYKGYRPDSCNYAR